MAIRKLGANPKIITPISKPIKEDDEIYNYGFSNKLEIYGILYGDCQRFS